MFPGVHFWGAKVELGEITGSLGRKYFEISYSRFVQILVKVLVYMGNGEGGDVEMGPIPYWKLGGRLSSNAPDLRESLSPNRTNPTFLFNWDPLNLARPHFQILFTELCC